MKKILFIFLLIFGFAYSTIDAAATPEQIKVATVDFQRILRESKLGQNYIKKARSNIEKKQSLLNKLSEQFNAKRNSFNEQKLVLEERKRDEKEEELAYKANELKRKREDFELEVRIADSRFQRDILRLLGSEVKVVAEQLGYDLVFSNEAPGLMFLNTELDITDKVLERMNK
tara:strand:+ start:3769 stop:4287 length:519 start_codon:yes stop_codon:yes gene_type:complete